MLPIRITNFGGVSPRIEAEQLPANGATVAENVRLLSHGLRPWKGLAEVFSSAKSVVKAMYRMYSADMLTDYWNTWIDDVDVVRAPFADTEFRIYYTGDSSGTGGPHKTNRTIATGSGNYPHDYLEMGIPKPSTAPTITGYSGGVGSNVTESYVYTYYSTNWAEEGPPSDAVTGTGKVDDTWALTIGGAGAPAGKYDIDKKRIYRTVTAASGLVDFYFVAEVAVGNTTYNDNRATNTNSVVVRNGSIPSIEIDINGNFVVGSSWDPPDAAGIGLRAGPNGILSMHFGNTLAMCEPNKPHAWPIRYRYTVPHPIVAHGWIGRLCVVATRGQPFLFVGDHPLSMSREPIRRTDMACVSKRSFAILPWGAAWAAPAGLAVAGAGAPGIVTLPWMSEREWTLQVYPSTIIGVAFEDKYLGCFDAGTQRKAFLFDPTNEQGPFTFLNYAVDGAYVDPESGKLYLSKDNKVRSWDTDANNYQDFEWRSKVFVLPREQNYGAYKVEANFQEIDATAEAQAAQLAADIAYNATLIGSLTDSYTNNTAGRFRSGSGDQAYGSYNPSTDAPWNPTPYQSFYGGGGLLRDLQHSSVSSRALRLLVYSYDKTTKAMVLRQSVQVTSSDAGTLISGYASIRYQFGLIGNITVSPDIRIAQNQRELASLG